MATFERNKRRAVSELYASLLLIVVTLSFGGVVTVAAVNQFNLSSSSGSLAAKNQLASAGKQVSFVYATVLAGSGSCTTVYRGVAEGKTYYVGLFDYGSSNFTPTEVADNATVYVGAYPSLLHGNMTTFTLILSSCAHPSGQTFLFADSTGDEVQVGT